jgi:hypothetical protein
MWRQALWNKQGAPSMNDNMAGNDTSMFPTDTRLITEVRQGMMVRDVTGQELGTVEQVKIGDPEAATARGTYSPPDDLVTDALAAMFGGGTDVPQPKRSQLLRYGFIKIDGPGLSDTDRFVRSDKIKDVSGDTVTLAVSKDQLMLEQ